MMLSFILHLNLLLGACGTLLYVNLGDNVTLPCYYSSTANYLCWYRQVAGEQPRLIFSFYKHAPDAPTFYNSFTEKQFTLYAGDGFYHLNISDVQYSDSAMYYCGETNIKITKLNKGTFLALRDQSRMSFLQQSDSLSVERGASVTLKCTVLPGNGDAEHSVYWFKKDSAEPHLGLLYVHSHSGHCVQPSGSTAKSCVYSLSKSGVKPSDSGMYYCAVASCGEIMFGKGTNLDVQGSPCEVYPVHMHLVIAALLLSVVLNLVLFGVLFQKLRRKYLQSKGSQRQQRAPVYTSDIQNEEPGAVQYVALDFKKGRGTSRRQRNTGEETVYAGVKSSDMD
ncbi:uncharacterized protein LOC115395551 isoform X2 [Salarias fasciatus]|uniref:uncharacterized protein LOC115395551 isoform X2 n=1 Tax=Salarias fasciatus TaxID=181472 RepID=UPI001176B8ED|nr:uncharacterized protein LOC115395551 isoform X2 [Salarias fasciatus]